MTQGDPSTARLAALPAAGVAHSYRPAVLAGLFGAALLALWFFYLDYSRGRPLYTPTLMAMALLDPQGLNSPEMLAPSFRLALMFTAVHGAVFVLLGVAVARLLSLIERGPSVANVVLATLALFIIFAVGFFGFAMTLAPVTVQALDPPDVLIGNGIAAAGMAVYLLRHY